MIIEEIQALVSRKLDTNFQSVYPLDIFVSQASPFGRSEYIKPYHSSIVCKMPVIRCEVCIEGVLEAEVAAIAVVTHVLKLSKGLRELLITPIGSKRIDGKSYLSFKCVAYQYDGQALRYVEQEDTVVKISELHHVPFSPEPFETLVHVQNIVNLGKNLPSYSEFANRLTLNLARHQEFLKSKMAKLHALAAELDRVADYTRIGDPNKAIELLTGLLGEDPRSIQVLDNGQLVPLVAEKYPLSLPTIFEYVVLKKLSEKN